MESYDRRRPAWHLQPDILVLYDKRAARRERRGAGAEPRLRIRNNVAIRMDKM